MTDDLERIDSMLLRAAMSGLVLEVVWKFGDYRALGKTVKEAVVAALREWDL